MTRPPNPRDGRWPSPGGGGDGWGPSTAVYSSAASQAASAPAPPRVSRGFSTGAPVPETKKRDGDWDAPGPRSGREQRAVRAADRRTERSVQALAERTETVERGLPWWGALLLLLGIAGVGALIDNLGSINGKTGFNIGIVIASIVAIIAVQRSHMFPVVIAPPIIYSGAALIQFYVRRATAGSGVSKQQVLLDAAANYLVYGFPAIAGATAAVLLIAGVRLISRK